MRHLKFLLILSIIIVLKLSSVHSQCLDFAKTVGFSKLDTSIYIPDGRLNAIPLSEGDNLDVYKPFFRGRKYKVVVVGANNLPKISFKVVNFQRQVLFDSKENSIETWEFQSEKNQNLIISVEIPAAKSGAHPKTGCIAVVVGFAQK